MTNNNSKYRNRTEVQDLKQTIAELKSENRSLRKRLKELSKKEHIYDETINSEISSDDDDTPNDPTCTVCKTGYMKHLDFGRVKYFKCTECDHRVKDDNPSE